MCSVGRRRPIIDGALHTALRVAMQCVLDVVTRMTTISRMPAPGSLDLVLAAVEHLADRVPLTLTVTLREDLSSADFCSAGIGATAPGGHPSMMYGAFPTVTGPDGAEQFVADLKAEGSDFLKVIYDGDSPNPWDSPRLRRPAMAALVEAAHRHGLTVSAHCTSAIGVAELVDAGADVIQHVPLDRELDDLVLQRMASNGIALTPTDIGTDRNLRAVRSWTGSHRSTGRPATGRRRSHRRHPGDPPDPAHLARRTASGPRGLCRQRRRAAGN